MNDAIKLPRLLLASLCLLISFLLYALYRSEHTVVNVFLSHSLPYHSFETLRLYASALLPLPDAITWRIPAGFWILGSSLLTHDCAIPLGTWHLRHLRLAWLPPFIALAIEVAQFFHWTDGSFDPWDIVTAVIAGTLASWSADRLAAPAFPAPWNWLFGATCLIVLFLADIKP